MSRSVSSIEEWAQPAAHARALPAGDGSDGPTAAAAATARSRADYADPLWQADAPPDFRAGMLSARIAQLKQEIADANAQRAALERAGLIHANEHWRSRGPRSRYMVLIYPMRNGVRPTPTYIGCKPEKVRAAKEGIRRAAEWTQTMRRLARLEAELARCVASMPETAPAM